MKKFTVKCPCLNCAYFVTVEKGYFHYSEDEAYDILKLHILEQHTLGELKEWLERALVQYFYDQLHPKS